MSERADDASALSQLHPHQRVGDGLLYLLLPDAMKKLPVLRELLAKNVVQRHGIVLEDVRVLGILVAEVEVDEATASRRPATARVTLRLVVADPAVKDGHFLAGRDCPRGLDASFAVGEDGRIGVAAMVAEPAARHAGVR